MSQPQSNSQHILEHVQKHVENPYSAENSFHQKFAQALHTQIASSDTKEGSQPATPENGTMLQAFEWYTSDDGSHLQRLAADMPALRDIGISALWLPPLCKAASTDEKGNPTDTGYGVKDLWDLGEYPNWGGKTRTKYGDIHDVDNLVEASTANKMNLYFDAVLNHKAGANGQEECTVREVNPNDRMHDVSGDFKKKGWLYWRLPDRPMGMQEWHWYHFTGFEDGGKIYRIMGEGKDWAEPGDVDEEKGNYDFLMFSDIDHRHPDVRNDMFAWSTWVTKRLSLHGFRFDAIKHFSESFLLDLLNHISANAREDFFCVGEYWKDDIGTMTRYLDKMKHQFSLFDCELVRNFSNASKGQSYDLRKIFDGSLVQAKPINAVTLVANHDTQKGQSLQIDIDDWFKPIAHALILLRISGYPCVFWGDLVGTLGPDWGKQAPRVELPGLILARKLYAYGEQHDYFDYSTCIGWVRKGTWDRRDGLAVVCSNAGDGYKWMEVGREHKGETWTDVLGWSTWRAVVNDDGWAEFRCHGCSVGVYVREGAAGREMFGKYRAEEL